MANTTINMVTRRQTVEKEVIHIDETTEMEFKDEAAAKIWDHFVEVNSKDDYHNGIVTYARRWAKYMQYLMQKHNMSLIDIVDNASDASDIEGVTGYMYRRAIDILSNCWKYGEELSKWHNKAN